MHNGHVSLWWHYVSTEGENLGIVIMTMQRNHHVGSATSDGVHME